MPSISGILRSKFPYTPTKGQEKFFSVLDDMVGKTGRQKDTLVLRGYAGTGKTTVISTLVPVLPLFNYRFVLLAPTGRAAKVISSYCGKNAYTIHKMIYRRVLDPKTGDMRFVKQKNYYTKTVFIIDEASLISDESGFLTNGLLSDLTDYVFEHPSNKMILVGDNAQLPPVGSNTSPGLDLSYLKQRFGLDAMQVELKEVQRQESESGILSNATQLREAVFDEQKAVFFETRSYSDIFKMTHEKLEEGIRYAFDKYGLENTAIICRSNWQAVRYNEYVRRMILFKEDEIEAGDMIMVVKNNYFVLEPDSLAGFIANGEYAEVRKIFSFEEAYGHRFAEVELQLTDYPDSTPFQAKVILDTLHSNTPSLTAEEENKLYRRITEKYGDIKTKLKFKEAVRNDEYLNALRIKFAYALTCHKSQGGQWKAVFIDHGGNNQSSEDRDRLRWLYTAITRAEKEVYLVNFDSRYFMKS